MGRQELGTSLGNALNTGNAGSQHMAVMQAEELLGLLMASRKTMP